MKRGFWPRLIRGHLLWRTAARPATSSAICGAADPGLRIDEEPMRNPGYGSLITAQNVQVAPVSQVLSTVLLNEPKGWFGSMPNLFFHQR
jgi:hypothetical protein